MERASKEAAATFLSPPGNPKLERASEEAAAVTVFTDCGLERASEEAAATVFTDRRLEPASEEAATTALFLVFDRERVSEEAVLADRWLGLTSFEVAATTDPEQTSEEVVTEVKL